MFYLDKLNGKTVMKTDILEGLTHYFTTRECPIKSKEPEMQEIVEQNRKMFCEALGIAEKNLIYPEQRHTDTVEVAEIGKTYYPEADALILTNHEQAVFLNFVCEV